LLYGEGPQWLASLDATGASVPGPAGPASSVFLGSWSALLRTADDQVIVAGSFLDTISFTRLLADGTPDADFGENGIVSTVIPARLDGPAVYALQSDGRIVVSGTELVPPVTNPTQRFWLARFWN
jgi:hypothetical protein